MLYFSAKYVVTPEGVDQNHGNDQQRTYQHKALTLCRRGRLPQGDRRWNNMRPDADPKPAKAEKNKPQRQDKRPIMALPIIQAAPQIQTQQDDQSRNRQQIKQVRQRKPARGDGRVRQRGLETDRRDNGQQHN